MRTQNIFSSRREFLRLAICGGVALSFAPSAVWAQDAPTAFKLPDGMPALPDGVAVAFEKIEAQPAVAIVKIGDVETRVEACEPIEKVPEAAREYVLAAWEKSGEYPKKRINVEIDYSEAPDAKEWAESARSRLIYWFPKIVETLDGPEGVEKLADDYKIRLVFKPMDGVAYAAGREITVSSKWIKRSPQDFGLVVHEATHVAQHYRGGEFWTTEGIADYVRYYISEPRSKNHWKIDPNRSKYTDGYGVTATFFDWLIREKDPEFMIKLHRALRARKNGAQFCADEYDATPDELWNEFLSSLK